VSADRPSTELEELREDLEAAREEICQLRKDIVFALVSASRIDASTAFATAAALIEPP